MVPGPSVPKGNTKPSDREPDLTDQAVPAVARAAAGDRAGMMWLYDHYAGTLFALAVRITGSPAEAEEVVQDAMVRAWIDAPSFDPARGTPGGWLTTLTRNRAIDVVRARGRRERHETDAAVAPGDPGPSPEHAAGTAEQANAVRRALAVLSAEQRRAVDLAYFDGLSHSEIADRLGRPLGTVKTHIAQAVRKLRDVLERYRPPRDDRR